MVNLATIAQVRLIDYRVQRAVDGWRVYRALDGIHLLTLPTLVRVDAMMQELLRVNADNRVAANLYLSGIVDALMLAAELEQAA